MGAITQRIVIAIASFCNKAIAYFFNKVLPSYLLRPIFVCKN